MNENTLENSPTADIFSSTFLLGNVAAPFVIGIAVGYFAKKMLKTALFIGGGVVVLLFIAEYYGVVSVNGAVLQEAASSAVQVAKQSGGFLLDRLSAITSRGVSGAGGFYIGFKLG
jgi:uncharacterized membrane protein (Fun14 family)